VPQTGDDGAVVAKAAIAMHFAEVFYHQVEVVGEDGSFGVTGDEDGLPSGEVGVDAFELGGLFALEGADLGRIIDAFCGAELSQLFDLEVEPDDLFFELQVVALSEGVVMAGHSLFFIKAGDGRCFLARKRQTLEALFIRTEDAISFRCVIER